MEDKNRLQNRTQPRSFAQSIIGQIRGTNVFKPGSTRPVDPPLHAPIEKPKLCRSGGAKRMTHFSTPAVRQWERTNTRPGANICTFARGVDQRGSRFGARVTRGGKRRIGHKAARRSTVTRSNRAWNRLNTRDYRLSTPLSIVSSRVHPLATCHLPRGCFRGLLVAEWKLTTFFTLFSFSLSFVSFRDVDERLP